MIIALGLTKENTIKFSEKIREDTGSANFDSVGHTTISLGITFPKTDDTKEDLLKRTDATLYMSKNNCRNQINIL